MSLGDRKHAIEILDEDEDDTIEEKDVVVIAPPDASFSSSSSSKRRVTLEDDDDGELVSEAATLDKVAKRSIYRFGEEEDKKNMSSSPTKPQKKQRRPTRRTVSFSLELDGLRTDETKEGGSRTTIDVEASSSSSSSFLLQSLQHPHRDDDDDDGLAVREEHKIVEKQSRGNSLHAKSDGLDEIDMAEMDDEDMVEVESEVAPTLDIETGSPTSDTETTLECQCCYGDVPFEEMVSCRTEGHLFCVDCLRRHAEERVFGVGNLETKAGGKGNNGGGEQVSVGDLTCMHTSDCTSGFDLAQLEKALPPKVMLKYHELQFTTEVEKAGIDDLCKCPKCNFQAVVPSTEMIFRCPVSDCQYESCRKCGEPPHIPLRCSEVEKKRQTDGRTTVEEAMTAARVRTCPKSTCKKRFFKTEGCNEMTCSCGTKICYVCRADITERSVRQSHFCMTPLCQHQSCNKCPQFSDTEQDDQRAIREAGLKAAEEVREKSLLGSKDGEGQDTANNHSGEVRVDVDALMKGTVEMGRRGPGTGQVAMVRPAPEPDLDRQARARVRARARAQARASLRACLQARAARARAQATAAGVAARQEGPRGGVGAAGPELGQARERARHIYAEARQNISARSQAAAGPEGQRGAVGPEVGAVARARERAMRRAARRAELAELSYRFALRMEERREERRLAAALPR